MYIPGYARLLSYGGIYALEESSISFCKGGGIYRLPDLDSSVLYVVKLFMGKPFTFSMENDYHRKNFYCSMLVDLYAN